MQRMFTFVHNERVLQMLRNHFHGSKKSFNQSPSQNVIAPELFLDRLDASRAERMARPLSRVHYRLTSRTR